MSDTKVTQNAPLSGKKEMEYDIRPDNQSGGFSLTETTPESQYLESLIDRNYFRK